MTEDAVSNAFEHLAKLTGSRPSLLNLLYMSDLWSQLRYYWEVLYEEIDRRRGKSHPIRALDFDLIYPTVWHAKATSPLKLEERMGFPMTASFVFRDTRTYFTIPPGALFELSFHILRLQEDYHLASGRLNSSMQKVDRLYREISSGKSRHTANARSILKEILPECKREVNRLIDAGAKMEALSNILTHEYYRPWDKIAEQAGASAEPSEIIKLWRIFSAARTHPEKDLSNYLDALSVASYYSLSRAQIRGGFRDFPLFASGTHVVLNLGPQVISSGEDYRPSRLQDIIHPVSIQYMAFATAMERFAEYNLDTLLTLAEAGLMGINKLIRRWRSFWKDYRVMFAVPEDVKEEDYYHSISFSQLSDVPSFRPLCEAYRDWRVSFEKTVGAIFIDITRGDLQISESYHRTKQRLLQRMRQSDGERAISSLVLADITKTFNWTPLTDVTDSCFLVLTPEDRPPYGKITSETIELLTLRRTEMLIEEAEVFADPIPTLRTTIKFADIKEEVLLVWERSVGHSAQLCYWNYSSNIEEALERIRVFLDEVYRKSPGKFSTRLHVFADDLYEDKSFEVSPDQIQWFDEILSISPQANYIRIDTNLCTVFLDVLPPGRTTRLEMAVMYEKDFHHQVATLYRQTSLFPLALSVVESLLREFADEFKRKEPWIIKLSGKNVKGDAS